MNNPSGISKRVSLTEVFIWGSLGYLGFAIELLGVMLSHLRLNHSRQISPFGEYVGVAVIVFTSIAPFPALYSLAKARRALADTSTAGIRILVWIFVVVGVLVSLAESMWTCSGHPTWLQGYQG